MKDDFIHFQKFRVFQLEYLNNKYNKKIIKQGNKSKNKEIMTQFLCKSSSR